MAQVAIDGNDADAPDELAALRQINDKLECFAYLASHDLRAPLRAMMSLTEWIREDLERSQRPLHDTLVADLDELRAQGARMDRLLVDLLEFSRIGTTQTDQTTTDAGALIADCVQVSGIPDGFTVRVGRNLPQVRCSPVEFSIAIRNLLSNAVKHHDATVGLIEIEGWRANGFGVFRVRDNGPGVPEADGAAIFEMFRTLDSSRGNGIGLGMVHKIVTGCGGTAHVTQNPSGRGCDFILSLPLADPEMGACRSADHEKEDQRDKP